MIRVLLGLAMPVFAVGAAAALIGPELVSAPRGEPILVAGRRAGPAAECELRRGRLQRAALRGADLPFPSRRPRRHDRGRPRRRCLRPRGLCRRLRWGRRRAWRQAAPTRSAGPSRPVAGRRRRVPRRPAASDRFGAPHMEFSGRRVLVTGAGKGIGRAIVKMLCERGAEVIGAHAHRRRPRQPEGGDRLPGDRLRPRRSGRDARGGGRRPAGRRPRQQCRHRRARALPRHLRRHLRQGDGDQCAGAHDPGAGDARAT